MSKFFRIKSKPKINAGRREANVKSSSLLDNTGDGLQERNAEEEEQLGKALEQQLSEKCENTESADLLKNADSVDVSGGSITKLVHISTHTAAPEPAKSFFRIKSKPKINTRREINFQNNNSLEKDETPKQKEENNTCQSKDDESTVQTDNTPEKLLSNNSENSEGNFISAEQEQISDNTPRQKEVFQIKPKSKFLNETKLTEAGKASESHNIENKSEMTADTQVTDTGKCSETGSANVEKQNKINSKGFFRIKSKPKIGVRSKTSSNNKVDTVSNKLSTEVTQNTEKNISSLTPVENDQSNEEISKEDTSTVDMSKIASKFPELSPTNSRVDVKLEENAKIESENTNPNRPESNEQENAEIITKSTVISTNVDRPLPPISPTKINRIKAVPRFSESDGNRQYSRIRNISVCSMASTVADGVMDTKEVLPIIQKKIHRTEQSRKISEARQEFQKRFGLKSPDKQKLKMIDLLFYNPATNPMSEDAKEKLPKKKKPPAKVEYIKLEKMEMDKEAEKVDNPEEEPIVTSEENKNPENESEDDGDGVPVPQIKIGPNGEIILDEQSLVIENKELEKQKEDIQNSDIVDGDIRTGYGVFKRAPRSQDWTHKETLRFYKALNVIGTDFSIMSELFPKRSRRELKIKFKKEEKINGSLINKAISMPCCYNYEQLKHDFRVDEEEERQLQIIADEEAKARKALKKKKYYVSKYPSKAIVSDSSDDETIIKQEKVKNEKIHVIKIEKLPANPARKEGSSDNLNNSLKIKETIEKVIQQYCDVSQMEKDTPEENENTATDKQDSDRNVDGGLNSADKNEETLDLLGKEISEATKVLELEGTLTTVEEETTNILDTNSIISTEKEMLKSGNVEDNIAANVETFESTENQFDDLNIDTEAKDTNNGEDEPTEKLVKVGFKRSPFPYSGSSDEELPARKIRKEPAITHNTKSESKPKKKKGKPKKKLAIDSDSSGAEDAVMEEEDGSESEEEAAMPILLPTRSGRLPKSKNVEQAQLVSMPPPQIPRPKTISQSRRTSSVSSTVSNESNLENAVPGSIMVLTEEGPDGKTIYKSYMVTPERSLTPLNVESDIIAKVIDYKRTDPVDIDNREERNVTIPASECVLDLRTNIRESSAETSDNVQPIDYSPTKIRGRLPGIENDEFQREEEELKMVCEGMND